MRFIDAHLHSDMVEDVQLQKLVMMGMEAAVVPSPHMFLGNPPVDTLFRIWDRFVTLEVTTAQTLGYESFASLSVPFIGLGQSDTEKALAVLPSLLKHERVVAMGEIGLDTGSEYEKDLFREHLRIAKAHDLPVILHTPIRFAPQGATVTPQIVADHQGRGFSSGEVRLRSRRRGHHRPADEHRGDGGSFGVLGQDASGGCSPLRGR